MYAISQAVAGNKIEIAAGTYNEVGEGNTFSRAGVVVNKNLTLTGAGAASTIVQVAAGITFNRVIYVISGVTATIEGMTIQNGFLGLGYGGGLYNDGTVTLNFSTVRNNSADIWGGGIYNSGMLSLNNSNVSDNYAGMHGGGLFNTGTMVLNNSTVSGNSASDFGGGLYNEGTLTITNSTLSGNSATGNSASSGGGVLNNGGTLNLYNAVLANSFYGGDCDNNFGIVTGNNNLIEATNGNNCGFANGIDGNIIGSDPNLGAPTGSPAYFPLNSGSLAIDAGDDAKCAAAPVNNTSQNGLPRPQGAHCDIGAYEFANSLAGSNVPVEPVDATTGTTPVAMTFTQIIQSGMTNLTTSSSGPPPPVGFSLGDPPIYYELTTTGVFSGTITLCIDYTGTGLENDPDEGTFQLYHREGGVWEPRTASLNVVDDIICGNVTSLSPFAILAPAPSQPPTVEAGGPYSALLGGSVVVSATGSNPTGGSLAFAWDLDGNSTFETSGQSVTFSAATLAPGAHVIEVRATNPDGLSATDQTTVNVIYNWAGFFQPVDNLPTLNVVKAGSAIPVKFSLNGDQGLNIFAAGYPVSILISCDTGAPQDAIEVTVMAGNSSLSYSAGTGTYTYVWKTDKAWAGCRQLVVRLNDGTAHVVNFKFK
jgi:hypothetical protein